MNYALPMEKPISFPNIVMVLGRIAGGAGNLLGRAVRGVGNAVRRGAAALGIGRSGGT